MTFRSKLLLSILAVVGATTVATLWIAQRQNSESYAAVIGDLFRSESGGFRDRQRQQLAATSEQARALAESVRLFAALEEGIPETYEIAGAELRVADRAFFRLADAKGNLITPPSDDAVAGLVGSGVDDALGKLVANARGGTKEQLGFVMLAPKAAAPFLASIATSPISNFDTTVGHLIIGHRVDFRPPSDAKAGAGLLSGLFVDGTIHSETIPLTLLPDVEKALSSKWEADEIERYGTAYRVDASLLNPGSAFPPAHLVSLYPLADFRARQRSLAWKIAGIGALGLLTAAAAGSLFAKRLSQPVRDLVAGTKQVREGNYDVRVRRTTSDELGTLADSFNEMAEGLALKEKYRSVLQLVTDREVADELMSGSVQLGGETREVSVIFCDIRGFTAMSQGMSPHDVIAMLNEHMTALTSVVHAHDGVVDKFVGDSIMSLFGAPKSYGKDAESAVRCAWGMVRERERLNAAGARQIKIGIGIATGPALAGCMGSESRLNYTVVGERVNLAARLCSNASPMDVVICETTCALLPVGFQTEPLEPQTLKGFTGSITAHRVTAVP